MMSKIKKSEEIRLTSDEVNYIIRLRNIWLKSLETGPLTSFKEWILAHEMCINCGGIPGEKYEGDPQDHVCADCGQEHPVPGKN